MINTEIIDTEENRKNFLMRYLFWNTNKQNNINNVLCQLILEYQPDIIGLAEYEDDVQLLLALLKESGRTYYHIPPMGARIFVISRFPNTIVEHGREDTHYVVKGFPYNEGMHKVVFVHLPSKREDEGGRRAAVLRKVRDAIDPSEKVVIMGDFNMNPFEKAMTSVLEMNAVSSAEIAQKRTRTYVDEKFPFFYNPMWNFLGDYKKPLGTYYYSTNQEESIYWNMFDQIIVSSELINDVNVENIRIIDSVGTCMLGEKGKPKISDHYPLYCELGGKLR